MTRTVLAIVSILVVAPCSGGDSPSANQPTEQAGSGVAPVEQPGAEPLPVTEDPADAEPPSECVSNCQRENAMKAVSAEQIEEDCQSDCGGW